MTIDLNNKGRRKTVKALKEESLRKRAQAELRGINKARKESWHIWNPGEPFRPCTLEEAMDILRKNDESLERLTKSVNKERARLKRGGKPRRYSLMGQGR